MVATLTAEALGVPIERLRVGFGDTDMAPYGLGGWGSRSTNVFGGALLKAAKTVTGQGAADRRLSSRSRTGRR